jgi:hypothetical protein
MSLDEFGVDGKQQPSPNAPLSHADVAAKTRAMLGGGDVPKTRLIQWTGHGPDRYHACEKTWNILPGGVYTIDMDEGKIIFCNQPINIDSLFYFTDSIGDEVIREIETFWNAADLYAQRGFRHRRGYMLYGPQGSGKSSIVQQTIARITERGGIVFLCTCAPSLLNQALQNFRLVEASRSVLCIFEDIDSIISSHGDKDILSLLDGESQIDFVLNLATTNYPERLDKRIVSRPRRFDRIIKVEMPPAGVRREYLKAKLEDASQIEIEHLVRESEGLSFAAMAEIIISVKCLGNDLNETLTILREMNKRKPDSREYDNREMGFGGR